LDNNNELRYIKIHFINFIFSVDTIKNYKEANINSRQTKHILIQFMTYELSLLHA